MVRSKNVPENYKYYTDVLKEEGKPPLAARPFQQKTKSLLSMWPGEAVGLIIASRII